MPDRHDRDGSTALRRQGYAASADAALGRRGARTRDLIKARASDLFITDGFHSTSVDAIAKAIGGSRATVYQYFQSKDDIYAELVRDCTRAIVEHAHGLGRLGPGDDGLRSLRTWLREWADVYDTHAAVFLEYPGIGSIDSIPLPDAQHFLDEFRAIIIAKIIAADVHGIDAPAAAVALTRTAHMVNLYRYRGMFELPDRDVTSESLAIAMQRLLFPEVVDDEVPAWDARLSPPPTASAERRRTVSATTNTSPVAEDVLSVSSKLFAERGYYATSIDDIAAEVGVSRATLYRHFTSKTRILAELTSAAVGYTEQLAAELCAVADGGPEPSRLYEWTTHYVALHRRYNGAIRAWFDGAVAEQLADAGVPHGIESLRGAVESMLDRVALPAGMNKGVAVAIVLAVLGRMTEPVETESATEGPYDTAALIVLILQRALLGSGTSSVSRRE